MILFSMQAQGMTLVKVTRSLARKTSLCIFYIFYEDR